MRVVEGCDESVPISKRTLAPLRRLRQVGDMSPRPHRIQSAGAVYHVFPRATGGESLFRDDVDRQRFLSILSLTAKRYRVELHFFVLQRTV